MKVFSKSTLLVAMLAAASCGAFAADTADLKVTGTIVPTSCTPSLSGGGIFDFGQIPAGSLSATSFTLLPAKSGTLTITCDAPVKVALSSTDSRNTSVVRGIATALGANTDEYGYGAGAVDGKNVGSYIINFTSDVTADGNTVARVNSTNSGSSWVTTNAGNVRPAASTLESWAATGHTAPGSYQNISQTISVKLGLNKTGNMPALNQTVPIDGLATFTLTYL